MLTSHAGTPRAVGTAPGEQRDGDRHGHRVHSPESVLHLEALAFIGTVAGLRLLLSEGGNLRRIDPRQGNAGRFADPGVPVSLCQLECGDGFLRTFAQIAKPDGGTPAD